MAYSVRVEPGVKINDPCWLTNSLIGLILSVTDHWEIVGYRYEWEKKVVKSHGFDLFLEVEYKPKVPGTDFPCLEFAAYPLPEWYVWWVDIIEYAHTKAILRLTLKGDMCLESRYETECIEELR